MIGLGSIIGDISGSVYEFGPNVEKDDVKVLKAGTHFTDDTVHTVATMDWLLENELTRESYAKMLKKWTRMFPNLGYGGMFFSWAFTEDLEPYGSLGNGSGMRVGPVALMHGTGNHGVYDIRDIVDMNACATHNHEEGVKGARAIALAMATALNGGSKEDIKNVVEKECGYNLNLSLGTIGLNAHRFDATCMVTVPEAIFCFLESTDYVDCIKTAISIGGDTDTIACMAGGIAECYYGVPEYLQEKAWGMLDPKIQEVVKKFNEKIFEIR